MFNTKRFVVGILLFVLIFSIYPKYIVWGSSIMWNKTYGYQRSDGANSLVETSDGGFALAGYTASVTNGDDFWLVKTDANGNMQWNQTYGGVDKERAFALIETSDGGFALAGETRTFGAGGYDFWLVKTDANGNMLWNRAYGGANLDIAFSLIETSDGGYVLAGYAETEPFGNEYTTDGWIVKTDASGNMQWNKTYGGTSWDEIWDLVELPDGGFALAGETYSFGAGSSDSWLVKTDVDGNMQWNQAYGGTKQETAWSIVETSDGGFALVGVTFSFGAGSDDCWIIKTNGLGNPEWNQTYGELDGDSARSLIVTSDGGYAIAGSTTSFDAGGYNFWFIKTDEYGNIPEFSSWIILPIFLVATVSMMLLKKKLSNHDSKPAI